MKWQLMLYYKKSLGGKKGQRQFSFCGIINVPLEIWFSQVTVHAWICSDAGSPGRRGLRSQITADLDTKCIKLADLSQTIWLIHSHSKPSEQGVEGRDQWHNRFCQTALQNAQTICGDNPDAISSIIEPPFKPQTNMALLPKKGKSQLSGRSLFAFYLNRFWLSAKRGHQIPWLISK